MENTNQRRIVIDFADRGAANGAVVVTVTSGGRAKKDDASLGG